MTFKSMWQAYIARNPHWTTDGADLTADGLRRLVEQTYELGREQGQREAMGDRPRMTNDDTGTNPIMDFLAGLKGKTTR